MILDPISDVLLKIGEGIQKILIGLVAGVFHIVNYIYQIFLSLAKGNLLTSEDYSKFTEKIYTILGVVMLFVLAYNILLYIVDPDKKDSTQSVQKILMNLFTSVIMIILCPYIFNFAFSMQDSILKSGAIGAFFTDNAASGTTIEDGGRAMAMDTFDPFFTSANGQDEASVMNESKVASSDEGIDCSSEGSCSLRAVKDNARTTGSFKLFKAFAMNIADSDSTNPVDFDWFLALIVGIFLCYVIISFCFDLAIRVFKVAFCQIIAPVAIMCRVIPKQEDVFNKWLKVTADTFLSVFIRVFIMNFGVYFIGYLNANNGAVIKRLFTSTNDPHAPNDLFVKAFLVMGIVAFIKSAPKLISDVFGFGSGDLKLGIKDKLKAGGAFMAGSTLGGSIESMKSNIANARRNGKGVGATIGSALAGGVSGGIHGLSKGRSAGSYAEMRRAAQEGAMVSAANRDARADRMKRYSTTYGDDKNRYIKGRISDVMADIKDWANDGAAAYEADTKKGQEFAGLNDAIKNSATKLREKFKTDSALVGDNLPAEWKNKALALDMNKAFNELKQYNGGQAFSLAQLENFIQQESSNNISQEDFYQDIFDEAGYNKAISNAIVNGVDPKSISKADYTNRAFNREAYNTAVFEHSRRLEVYNNMLRELEDKANEKIINSVDTGIGSIGKEKMLEVSSNIENFTNAFKLSGATITDKTITDPTKQKTFTLDTQNLAESIKNISDAAEHNAIDARRKAAIYEKNKAARQQDKK